MRKTWFLGSHFLSLTLFQAIWSHLFTNLREKKGSGHLNGMSQENPAPFDHATTVLTQENWWHLELIQRQTLEYKKIKVLACSKDSTCKPVKRVSFCIIQESMDTDIFPSLQEGLRALARFIFKANVWMYKYMKVRLLRLI